MSMRRNPQNSHIKISYTHNSGSPSFEFADTWQGTCFVNFCGSWEFLCLSIHSNSPCHIVCLSLTGGIEPTCCCPCCTGFYSLKSWIIGINAFITFWLTCAWEVTTIWFGCETCDIGEETPCMGFWFCVIWFCIGLGIIPTLMCCCCAWCWACCWPKGELLFTENIEIQPFILRIFLILYKRNTLSILK